ncbi:MAG TPA: beta-ketoacyl-[acyl-carrier-protein] synthase family protein [Spirochaetota bacterium]|nr:beta-ketoacyl-[acyl-carrier-protein] synthase family protein [Spirochaetota bacterium]HPP05029.1 beta-ketoacyl-[acyl-carrier-protein] synthase family protein [Spirochaetota bacterium]
MKKRIVITGMGVITTIGDNLSDFYQNLINGKSGITKIKSIDSSKIACKIAGDLSDYDFNSKINYLKENIPEDYFKRLKKIFKTAPFSTKITLLTAIDAYLNSGLFNFMPDKERISCFIGGHNLYDNYIAKNIRQFDIEPDYIDPLCGLVSFDADTVTSIAEVLQIYGHICTIGGFCASSGLALKFAYDEILLDNSDIVIVGGGSLDYSNIGFQALSMLEAISYKSFNDNPEKASRPFDRDREGFVFSHGSGVIVLESLEHALKRNANIYAEILAIDFNNDASHLPTPSVIGQTNIMNKVIKKSGIKKEDINYINAHATSTPLGDLIEIESIKKVFGEHAYKLKINATKSMIGHIGWTSNTIELIATILQMYNNKLHPTINIENLDERIDLDVCANKSIDYNINYFMKNSFGMGGINCSLIGGKFIK